MCGVSGLLSALHNWWLVQNEGLAQEHSRKGLANWTLISDISEPHRTALGEFFFLNMYYCEILWPHDSKSQLIGKVPDAGKD